MRDDGRAEGASEDASERRAPTAGPPRTGESRVGAASPPPIRRCARLDPPIHDKFASVPKDTSPGRGGLRHYSVFGIGTAVNRHGCLPAVARHGGRNGSSRRPAPPDGVPSMHTSAQVQGNQKITELNSLHLYGVNLPFLYGHNQTHKRLSAGLYRPPCAGRSHEAGQAGTIIRALCSACLRRPGPSRVRKGGEHNMTAAWA